MLTLVRGTYRASDDAGELLSLRDADGHPASAEDITGHLLDRVLPAAYTRQPGEPPPRYDLPTAERALRRIATRMNRDGTRDLQWWHLHARTRVTPRVIATTLAAGLVAGLMAGFLIGIIYGNILFEPIGEVAPGIVFGIAAGAMAWAHSAHRIIATGLAVGLIGGLLGGLVGGLLFWAVAVFALGAGFDLTDGLGIMLFTGPLTGIAAGLGAALAFRSGNKFPKRIAPVRWRQLFRRGPLLVGLLCGIVVGGFTGLADYRRIGIMAFVGPGVVAVTVAWLMAGFITGISQPETGNASPLSPISSRRSDQVFGLAVGLIVWLGVGLAFGIAFGIGNGNLALGLDYGFKGGLVAGLLVGLVYPQSWSPSLAFAQLAVSDRTPVCLMRFLEDARGRSVLRTVGPVYQFRHARLQDRLAEAENVITG